MKKPTILIQVVLATAITILSVAAITSATTIGTNISTGGTLTVTGNSTVNGMATTTAASGNIATQGTLSVIGASTLTGQLNFVNASSTGWLKVNTINTDLASTTFSKDIVFPNASSTGYLSVSSVRSDTGTTTFANNNLFINDGTSTSMFFTNSGDIIGLGVMGQGWRINDDSGNYVAGAGYGPSMSAGFLAVQAPSEGVATIAANDSNGNSLLQLLVMESFNVGTILLSNSATMSTQIQFEDSDADDQVYFWLDQTENRLEMYGTDGTETTQPGFLIGGRTQTSNYGLSSNDVLFANDIEVQDYSYLATTTIGVGSTLGIGTTTTSADLTVDGGGTATTSVDLGKVCFKVMQEDNTNLYIYFSATGALATSTTSCF